ncbi:serine--tRNA ligase [Candidatus Micrarchaeota archaeon]|nr:MAG: serine--tRNA ligase [Candidatus Micrarchaeota archaeon]
MIDIKLIREKPEVVRKNLEKRKSDFPLDDLISLDKKWRELKKEIDRLRKERNEKSTQIAEMRKKGKDSKELQKAVKKINVEIKRKEKEYEELGKKRKHLWMQLPNLLHDSVPYGEDEKDNVEIKRWGEPKDFDFPVKNHIEILEALGLIDIERGAKVAGARFYYIKDDLVKLDYALINFALDHMRKKGYVAVEPPYMMNRRAYEGVTDLADFETVMYKIENDDLYLIATSEHPMAAMFMDEIIDPAELPIKLTGISPCFRREVGSHGKYSKGLFRMHQFNKVEQFIFCLPEDSWDFLEELQRNAEELYESLGIPYRVVNVCTGDIGTVAAKKYDIEGWFPSAGEYKEIGSNSNCTDYQARRLNIRFGKEGGEKGYVHTLNNTALATSRTMIAIIENNQNEDGSVDIPKVLWKYLDFKRLEKK